MTQTPTDPLRLVPCPFCGGEAERFEMADRAGVRCADIMCAGSHRLPSHGEDYVAAWNRRAAAPSVQPDLEVIARIIDPRAFETLREVCVRNGKDWDKRPDGVQADYDPDLPIPNRQDARVVALAKADAILSALQPVAQKEEG